MTEHKPFECPVRARMAKTGESYTAARAMLLKAGDADPGEVRLATSEAKIRDRTGRGWEEWFGLLDEWGAADRTHRETARWVAEHVALEHRRLADAQKAQRMKVFWRERFEALKGVLDWSE